MDSKELLKKVRQIEIKSRRLSDNLFGGEYLSTFKGRGMTFSEVRKYEFGDDIRSIDWNVTARYNEPFIKIFEEERELTLMLLIDVSGSKNFATRNKLKKEIVTEIAATLAFSALKNNDKVLVSNGRSLVIKTTSSFYRYPLQKTPLNLILDKKFLIKKISDLNEKIIDQVYINYTIIENNNEINIFFDNKTFDLIGWQTKDIYQNLSITLLSSIQINQKISKNLFKLPLQN